MADCMTFPDTVEEFMEQYKIVDTKEVYTNGAELVSIFRMKQWFEHLAAAQPEDRCSECDAWNQYIHYPRTQQWIPCKERIPTEGEPFYVLCCDKYGGIIIGHISAGNDGKTPYLAENEYEYMYDCKAWMPLPKPWKREQDE